MKGAKRAKKMPMNACNLSAWSTIMIMIVFIFHTHTHIRAFEWFRYRLLFLQFLILSLSFSSFFHFHYFIIVIFTMYGGHVRAVSHDRHVYIHIYIVIVILCFFLFLIRVPLLVVCERHMPRRPPGVHKNEPTIDNEAHTKNMTILILFFDLKREYGRRKEKKYDDYESATFNQ